MAEDSNGFFQGNAGDHGNACLTAQGGTGWLGDEVHKSLEPSHKKGGSVKIFLKNFYDFS